MKNPGGLHIQAVVACACPIAIAIDRHNIKSQEPQQTVDIEDRFDLAREIFTAGFVQSLAQVDEGAPGFLLVLRLDLESLLIAVQLLAKVSQSAIGVRAAGYFPASSCSSPKVFLDEVLVELLDVTENPPTLAVDHDLDEICLGGGKEILRDEGIERTAHHRGIAVAVEQVQRLVAVESLPAFNKIH